ncbi:MAG: hypothetical protein ACJAXL_000887 [Alphaproteobacteria bacterium]|jgi:hypothetical protein
MILFIESKKPHPKHQKALILFQEEIQGHLSLLVNQVSNQLIIASLKTAV